jgi:hypothetical protein
MSQFTSSRATEIPTRPRGIAHFVLAFVTFDLLVEGTYAISGVWGRGYLFIIQNLRELIVAILSAVIAIAAFSLRVRWSAVSTRRLSFAVIISLAMGLGWFAYTRLFFDDSAVDLPVAVALSAGATAIAFVLMETLPPGAPRAISTRISTLRAIGFSAASLAVSLVVPWFLALALVR